MRLYGFLCLNGTEVAFRDRTKDYLHNFNITGLNPGARGDCQLLREGDVYVTPASDDAPWFDPNVSASANFLGILPERIDLLPVASHSVSQRANEGAIIGPRILKHRLLQFSGTMFATSWEGMAYGDRWVNEVLGSANCPDGCVDAEALVLPACPGSTANPENYLRRLLDVGIVDGPTITPTQDGVPECHLSKVTFQLAAGQPYLFSPKITCADEATLSTDSSAPTCCKISTNDWPGDAVAVIKLTAQDANVTNIHLTGKPTFDGNCPSVEGMPCWELTIPVLPRDGTITIDSARRQIRYGDPSLKVEKSGIRMVSWEGPLTYPEISPCSEFCVCAWNEAGDVTMTVEKVIREL